MNLESDYQPGHRRPVVTRSTFSATGQTLRGKLRRLLNGQLIIMGAHVPVKDLAYFCVLSLIILVWFAKGELIWGEDANYPLTLNTIDRYFYIWNRFEAFGSPDVAKFAFAFPYAVGLYAWKLLGLPFDPRAFQMVFAYCLVLGSGLSGYSLTRAMARRGVEHPRIAGIIGGTLYALNFYALTIQWASQGFLIFEYSFFPMILALIYHTLEGSQRKIPLRRILVITILWTILVTPGYVTVSIVFLNWTIVLLVIFLHYLLGAARTGRRNVSFLALLVLTWTVFNTFWLGPVAAYGTIQLSSYTEQTGGVSLFLLNSVSLVDGVRLMGYWALGEGYKGSHFYPWFSGYSNPLMQMMGFVPFFWSGIALLSKKKDKGILIATLLMLTSLFLIKGARPPFGEANIALFSIFPLNILFRATYQRFAEILVMAYAVLMGAGVSVAISFLSKRKPKNVPREAVRRHVVRSSQYYLGTLAVAASVSLALTVFVHPLWTGSFLDGEGVIPSKAITLPRYLTDLAEWIESQPGDFNVFTLPFAPSIGVAYWWENGSQGYTGINLYFSLMNKPLVVTGSVATELAAAFAQENVRDATVLSMLNVKFLTIHWDTNWRLIEGNSNWISPNPMTLNSTLANVTGLTKVRSFGPIDVYENTLWIPTHAYFSDDPPDRLQLYSLTMLALGETERIRFVIGQNLSESPITIWLPISHEVVSAPNFDSLRFTYRGTPTGAETPVPHWLRKVTPAGNATVAVRIPSAHQGDIVYAYYGNPTLPSASKPHSVFEFYDDFATGDLTKWDRIEGNWSLERALNPSGSHYVAVGGHGESSVVSKKVGAGSGILSAWVMFSTNTSDHFVITPITDSYQQVYAVVGRSNGIFGYFDTAWHDFPAPMPYAPGVWYSINMSFDVRLRTYWVSINDQNLTPEGLLIVQYGDGAIVSATGKVSQFEILTLGANITLASAVVSNLPPKDGVIASSGEVERILPSPTVVEPLTLVDANPTRYVWQADLDAASYFVFLEAYDSNWELRVVSSQRELTPHHFLAEGFANGWYIDATGPMTLTLTYRAQTVVNASFAASGIAIATACAWLVIPRLKKTRVVSFLRRIVRQDAESDD